MRLDGYCEANNALFREVGIVSCTVFQLYVHMLYLNYSTDNKCLLLYHPQCGQRSSLISCILLLAPLWFPNRAY